ncbi:hypothetical protein Pla111_15170 [Botrimarina hoheduenensis]|uniref:HTH cro/C1-type domain-containing protein n=2 Tax=Botrimarina hoheduenensis TaxID=2528000 RepID=A0A5C5W8S1_9BACT|nr:hypothetical protein Pla111_15170 [Botrimarina hoheduenensis]
MARDGLTYEGVCQQTGLDARTLRGILHAAKKPHAKTLKRLAEGLGVSADDLFAGDAEAAVAEFDLASNPAIEAAVEAHESLFEDWTPHDFGELASRVGVGGPMTEVGVVLTAQQMNANRSTLDKARTILESDQAELLRGMIEALYVKATLNR